MDEKNLHNNLTNEADQLPSIDKAWEGMKVILEKEMPVIYPKLRGYKTISYGLRWAGYIMVIMAITILEYPKIKKDESLNQKQVSLKKYSTSIISNKINNNFLLNDKVKDKMKSLDSDGLKNRWQLENRKQNGIQRKGDSISQVNTSMQVEKIIKKYGKKIDTANLNQRLKLSFINLNTANHNRLSKQVGSINQINKHFELNIHENINSTHLKIKHKNNANILSGKNIKTNVKNNEELFFHAKDLSKSKVFVMKELNSKIYMPTVLEMNKRIIPFQNTKEKSGIEYAIGIQERIMPIRNPDYFENYTGTNSYNRLIPGLNISLSNGKSIISMEGTFFYNTSFGFKYSNKDSLGNITGSPDSTSVHISKSLDKVFGSTIELLYKYRLVDKLLTSGGIQLFFLSKGLTREVKTKNLGAILLYDRSYTTEKQDWQGIRKVQVSLQAGIEYEIGKIQIGSRLFVPISNFNINKNSKLPISIEINAAFRLFAKKL